MSRPKLALLTIACGLGLAWCTHAEAQRLYRVRPGDTLTHIAQTKGMTVTALARLNRLDPANLLLAGSTIRLPGAPRETTEQYVVRPGDTLTAIAARYGTSVATIARLNRLDPSKIVFAGIALRVPRARPVAHRPSAPVARTRYRVRPGDTLTAIAARYGTTVAAIARANLLDPDGTLIAGAAIVIPSRPGLGKERPPATPSRDKVRASIERWAVYYGVRQDLALALAWMESGFQVDITSPAGAWGVMQVIPDTWTFAEEVLIGTAIGRTADGNVRVGLAYLGHLLRVFGGDERLALAGYFQGPRSVQMLGLLTVTKLYVADVLALAERM